MTVNSQPLFAMTVDFDAEELWIGESAENRRRPGVLSQATYGVNFGVPSLVSMLAELKLPATFFVCGRDALRHRGAVQSIADAGFEIAHHGLSHRSPQEMSRDDEARELVEAKDILLEFAPEVVGYRSPSWDFSPNTLELLEHAGFEYSSNLMSSIYPFRHDSRSLAELPVHWILDDAPHFWFDSTSWDKVIRNSHDVLQLWKEEAAAIWRRGGAVTLTVHPQIIGRPSRLEMLREFLEFVIESGVQCLTAREAAALAPTENEG